MPPVDGSTIGIVLAGITALVTALGAVQSRRDTRRKEEIAALRTDLTEQGREIARQRRVNIAAIRWVYACQLVMAARGVAEDSLPAMPHELEEVFRSVESDPVQPASGTGRAPGGGGAHRIREEATP